MNRPVESLPHDDRAGERFAFFRWHALRWPDGCFDKTSYACLWHWYFDGGKTR